MSLPFDPDIDWGFLRVEISPLGLFLCSSPGFWSSSSWVAAVHAKKNFSVIIHSLCIHAKWMLCLFFLLHCYPKARVTIEFNREEKIKNRLLVLPGTWWHLSFLLLFFPKAEQLPAPPFPPPPLLGLAAFLFPILEWRSAWVRVKLVRFGGK